MPGLKDKIAQRSTPQSAPADQAVGQTPQPQLETVAPAQGETAAPAPVPEAVQTAPAPQPASDINSIVAAVTAAMAVQTQQDKQRSSVKPLPDVQVDPTSREQAEAEVRAAGWRWFYLSQPRYVQDRRWAFPKLVQASFRNQAKVQLSAKVVRVDRATGKCTAEDRACDTGIQPGPFPLPVDGHPGLQKFGPGASVVDAYGEQAPREPVDVEVAPNDPFAPGITEPQDAATMAPDTPTITDPAGPSVDVHG